MVHRFRFPTLLALALAVIALGMVSSGAADAAGSARTDVIIGFKGQPGPAEQALVRQAGGTIRYTYHLVPAIAASVPEAAIAGLQANPNVTNIDLDIKVHAIDAELDNTWGVKRIGAGTVHDGGNKGAGVKVGVLDTGIDTEHPDLSYEPTCSASFVDGESLEDGNGHGTHTAGTVAALDDNNDTSVVGVAPGATLCIYKVLSNSGSGSYSDVIAAVERAVTDGVQVTNNSYGSNGDPGPTVKAAFDNAYAAGVLHAAAAGNSGNPPGRGSNCIYPARWDSLIATAATKQNDNRATFSSTCPEMELAAPGYQINSTVPGGGYGTKSGTSMASPHVAGTAALVIATGITDGNGDGLINDEVRQRLDNTADDLGPAGRDTKYGFGLVDADEAAPAGPPPPATPGIAVTPTSGLITTEAGGTDTFTVVLDTLPSADVTIGLSSSNTTEGTVLPSSLTFTSANGTTPQTVTVTGVDDAVLDGDIAYTIVTAPATSTDPDSDYNGINAPDVSVTNTDDEVAAGTGTIQGRVKNANTGQKISGATVKVEPVGPSTTTNKGGKYTLDGVPEGSQMVTASVTGCTQTVTMEVVVVANDTVKQNFELAC